MPSNFESVTVQACVQGFVSAVGHHFVKQASAEVRRFGAVTTLQYRHEVEHPWPRVFRFKLELLAEEEATAAEIDHVYRYVAVDPQVECLVNLLVTDPGALVEELKPRGFTRAFDKVLMARSINLPQRPREIPEGLPLTPRNEERYVAHVFAAHLGGAAYRAGTSYAVRRNVKAA